MPSCVENKSSEEIGDFKEQIYQLIDSRISESRGTFSLINRRAVDAALRQTSLRPDELLAFLRLTRTVIQREHRRGERGDILSRAQMARVEAERFVVRPDDVAERVVEDSPIRKR